MHLRPLRDSDIPVLREMHAASGYAYDFPDLNGGMFEACAVVVDEQDKPIMAAAAERILQLYLFGGEGNPAVKLAAVRMLHDGLRPTLRQRGYQEANAFLPPQICKRFGRRLKQIFSWVENWPSFSVRI